MAKKNPVEQLPSISDILGNVGGADSSVTDVSVASPDQKEYHQIIELLHSERERYIHLGGLEDHYAHKKKWSWLLLLAIGGTFLFQFGLIVSVGLGALDFSDDQWLLPTFLVQSLGQVIGLAFIVVRSLFSQVQ